MSTPMFREQVLAYIEAHRDTRCADSCCIDRYAGGIAGDAGAGRCRHWVAKPLTDDDAYAAIAARWGTRRQEEAS